jgi:hypothetical protein
LVDGSACCFRTPGIERAPSTIAHEIVEEGVAWAGIAGDEIAVAAVGDVGDPPDIQNCDRPRAVDPLRQSGMENWHERRALTARSNIRCSKIEGYWNPKAPRKRPTITDLNSEMALGTMQHGLAVKPDDLDCAQRQAVVAEVIFDRIAVRPRDQGLRLGEDTWALGAVTQIHGIGQRLAQQRPLSLGIRTIPRRPEPADALAIGFDRGYVDSVKRSSTHETNGLDNTHSALG